MKCKKGCKEVVHFVSPEMSSLFSHAIVNLPDGSEKYFSITQPRKWRVKGNDWKKTPIEANKPIYTTDKEFDVERGLTIMTPRFEQAEIVYNSRYTGIDKADQYYKDIKKVNQFVEQMKPKTIKGGLDD